jgi:hypothetical protein
VTTPLEDTLADRFHARAATVSAPADTAAVAAVGRRSSAQRRRRRAQRALGATAAVGVVAAAVAAVVLLPGSGPDVEVDPASSPDRPADTTVLPPPASEETGMPALPLDAYDPDLDTLTVQAEASRRLTDECLVAAGYDPVPAGLVPVPVEPDIDRQLMVMHDYGVVDAGYARQHGYRTPQAQLEAERLAGAGGPTLREQYGIDDAWGLAMQQCGQQAGEQLRGGEQDMADPAHPANTFGRLAGVAHDATAADDRVLAVTQAWSACMAGKGYAYDTPLDPLDDVPVEPAPTLPPLSEQEVATALADVACKQEVGFEAVWFAVEAEHQQAQIDAHPDEIAAAQAWYSAMADRARAAVAG